MQIVIFNDCIGHYRMTHVDSNELDITVINAIKKYDIVSYFGNMVLNSGDTPLSKHDYINNIHVDSLSLDNIKYVFNDKEYDIVSSTNLIPFLTTLKPIMIRNKTNNPITILFNRYYISNQVRDKFLNNVVYDGNNIYYYGEIHSTD